MVVDEFVGGGVERDEGGGNEAGGRVHVAVGAWRRGEERRGVRLHQTNVRRELTQSVRLGSGQTVGKNAAR